MVRERRDLPADLRLRADLGLPLGCARLEGRLGRLVHLPSLRGAAGLRANPRLGEGRLLPDRAARRRLRGDPALPAGDERAGDDVQDADRNAGADRLLRVPRVGRRRVASGSSADTDRPLHRRRGRGEGEVRPALRLRVDDSAARDARGRPRRRLRRRGCPGAPERAPVRPRRALRDAGKPNAASRRGGVRRPHVPASARARATTADARRGAREARGHERDVGGVGRALPLRGPVPRAGRPQRARPVRIGNGAYSQFQLDVFGELLDTVWIYRQHGGEIDDVFWEFLGRVAGAVIDRWRLPDQGIWEIRGEPRHFTYSKVMAWVALDRVVRIAELDGREGALDEWRAERDEVRELIEREGVHPESGAFVQSFADGGKLDASNLMIPIVGFVEHTDPRAR